MDGTTLISTIMGSLIDPWEIKKIETDNYEKVVHVYMEYPKAMGAGVPCAESGRRYTT